MTSLIVLKVLYQNASRRTLSMVRLSTRLQAGVNWNDSDICPKLQRLQSLRGKSAINQKHARPANQHLRVESMRFIGW